MHDVFIIILSMTEMTLWPTSDYYFIDLVNMWLPNGISTEICRKINMQCMGFALMDIVRFWSIGYATVNTLCGEKK